MNLLRKLNSLQIIKDEYQEFWNHNFRGCGDVMDNITKNQAKEIKAIYKLIRQKEDYKDNIEYTKTQIYLGASSIFLRAICNLFNSGGILDKQCLNLIPINKEGPYIDKHDCLHYTSLSRLVLMFFDNCDKARIDQLFKALDGLYTPQQIAMALYLLLDKNSVWRRLLYYTDNALPNDNLKENLLEQAENYIKDDYYGEYPELSLCPCGKKYIRTISSSFEFYACRCNPERKSLFRTNVDEEIEKTIEMVLISVENCCKRLQIFRSNFMKYHKNSNIEYFLKQSFNARTHSEKPQLHEERLIFNHIGYLEGYRHYAVKKRNNSEDKIKINKILVQAIKKYLELYNTYISEYDSQRSEVAKDLAGQVEKIETLEYNDFITKISRENK